MSEPRPLTPLAATTAIAVCWLWGSMYVATKFAFRDASPLMFSGLRMIPASLALYVVARIIKAPLRLSPRQWYVVSVITALYFLNTVFLYIGLRHTSVGHVTILMNSSVIFTMLFSRPLLRVRVLPIQWIGVCLAFAGVSFVLQDRGQAGSGVTILGDVMILVSGFLWGLYNIFYRRLGGEIHNATMVFYMDLLTIAPFMLLAFLVESVRVEITGALIISALYVALVTHSLGFLLWNWLLKTYDTNKVAAFSFLNPPAGVVLGAIFFHEQIGLWVIAGLGLVSCGIYLINRHASPG